MVHPGPEFAVQDVYQGWVDGLDACGVTVGVFNLNDRLAFYGNAKLKRGKRYLPAFQNEDTVRMAATAIKAVCYEFWPDVLLIVSGFFVPPDFYPLFRNRGHKVVLLHTECPYEDDRQIERAQFADLNLLNDPTNIDRFPGKSLYMPHAYDPERHHPGEVEPELASDFCFVGTGFKSRTAFFESVDWTGIDATFAGNWQGTAEGSPLRSMLAHEVGTCCPNDEAVRLYRSTKVSANLYRKEAERPELSEGWALSPREIEMAACGTFFLRESRGEGDEVFPMLPTFTEPGEFGDLVRWWKTHDEQREKAAAAARCAVASRTFENNARLMLEAL